MSVTGNSGIGIPILVLHDALGGEITIELKDGCSYTGMLDDVQDNMNCTLKGPLTRTNEEGETSELDMTFVRGSQIRFIVLPHILKEAPYFQRIHKWRKYKGSFLYGVGGGKTPGPGMGGMGGLNPMGIPGMEISMGLSMGIGMGGGPTMGPPPGQMQVSFGGQQFGPPPWLHASNVYVYVSPSRATSRSSRGHGDHAYDRRLPSQFGRPAAGIPAGDDDAQGPASWVPWRPGSRRRPGPTSSSTTTTTRSPIDHLY